MKNNLLITCIASALALAISTRAEEGGSAHYMPGANASFIDAFPAKPGGIAVLDFFTYYKGSALGDRQLPLGGLLTSGIDATVYANTVAAIYQTPWNVLGGGLAMGVAVPYVWVEVSGEAQRISRRGQPGERFSARDTANGIGDITVYPFMLGWTNVAPDLKLDLRLGIYAPTGEYEQGQLANVGKNYWSFEPGFMASWLSSKIGTEVSLYTGIDFNTENPETDYTSGTSLHMDLTVAQHLPLLGGFAGLGANAFYYQQLTGDSGSGAQLGDFKGMTCGIGPVISYIRPLGGDVTLLAEVKWLPELSTAKRLEGDYIWMKVGILF